MSREHTYKTLIGFERLLLLTGAFLLCAFAALQIYRVVYARAMVQRFSARTNTQQSGNSLAAVASRSGIPDFRFWSEKRIEAFQLSLMQKFPAPLGILRIRSLDLEVPVLEGTDDSVLNRGVGHIEGTTAVNAQGNIGIAGHRDGFFRVLKEIRTGDRIDLQTESGSRHYTVDRIVIVPPEDVSVLDLRASPTLTLVTCYPFYFVGSAPLRYIVQASESKSNEQTNSGQAGTAAAVGGRRRVQ